MCAARLRAQDCVGRELYQEGRDSIFVTRIRERKSHEVQILPQISILILFMVKSAYLEG